MQTERHTERNASKITDTSRPRSLHYYLAMNHPETLLLHKSWLRWMLCAVFVGGLCIGLIAGKWLA